MFINFPSLFSLESNKEAPVVDFWDPIRKEGGWSPLFTGSFNDWELEEVQIFLQLLQEKRVIMNQEDVVLMKDVKDWRFSVMHFYLLLATVQESLFPLCFV